MARITVGFKMPIELVNSFSISNAMLAKAICSTSSEIELLCFAIKRGISPEAAPIFRFLSGYNIFRSPIWRALSLFCRESDEKPLSSCQLPPTIQLATSVEAPVHGPGCPAHVPVPMYQVHCTCYLVRATVLRSIPGQSNLFSQRA